MILHILLAPNCEKTLWFGWKREQDFISEKFSLWNNASSISVVGVFVTKSRRWTIRNRSRSSLHRISRDFPKMFESWNHWDPLRTCSKKSLRSFWSDSTKTIENLLTKFIVKSNETCWIFFSHKSKISWGARRPSVKQPENLFLSLYFSTTLLSSVSCRVTNSYVSACVFFCMQCKTQALCLNHFCFLNGSSWAISPAKGQLQVRTAMNTVWIVFFEDDPTPEWPIPFSSLGFPVYRVAATIEADHDEGCRAKGAPSHRKWFAEVRSGRAEFVWKVHRRCSLFYAALTSM